MTSSHDDLLRDALAGMTRGPKPLLPAVQFYAEQDAVPVANIERDLVKRIQTDPNDTARRLLRRQLDEWDWEDAAPWTGGTRTNTARRRQRVYDLLTIGAPLRKALDEHVSHYEGPSSVLVEARDARGDWYTPAFRKDHAFYAEHLRTYLGEVRGLPMDSVNLWDAATTRILERLGDPTAVNCKAARGLVVGYVQSGKTTNFTGVIAKAIDAGYRLIIVLSGTTNLLRNQSQRRLDMDLVGVENILRNADEDDIEHDYKDDDDWPAKFISFGGLPSKREHPDIVRATGQEDFQSISAGVSQFDFEFEKVDKRRPLYDKTNLGNTSAKLVVVKKQKDRLQRLLKELKAVGTEGCAEVPALIIDDESDQASVNTLHPNKASHDRDRTTINNLLVSLLKQLPRAQYIGYTATPFANVFVKPDDPADIYPRDFILSLERPATYMGVREFHDFAPTAHGRLSNEAAYIRGITSGQKTNDDRLAEAIDAFVLTGALKKWRSAKTGVVFKHHTMLVHKHWKKGDHKKSVDEIRRLWKKAGYDSPGPGQARLNALFESDFKRVWNDRGKPNGLRFPSSFGSLKPYLGAALDEIRKGDPVLKVNSAEGADVPEFDKKAGVWKIIVGGAKLSRGYTVEGLTVSYFRRRSKVQDTLMQMGRWFGFRDGYQDLVRLYIGREEPDGVYRTLDLYKAFESICRDEEAFRDQLTIYERGSDGTPGLTPMEVPALVFNSHPALRPVARNKMFNARLTWAGFTYREPTTQAASGNKLKANEEAFRAFLLKKHRNLHASDVRRTGERSGFKFRWSEASHGEILSLLKGLEWSKEGCDIRGELGFLSQKVCPVDSWIVLLPQLADEDSPLWEIQPGVALTCISRTRASATRFNVYSDPAHVSFAKWLVGSGSNTFVSPDLKPRKATGVLLLYPTLERKARKVLRGRPVMGFALQLPDSPSAAKAAFAVQNPEHPDQVVVSKVAKS